MKTIITSLLLFTAASVSAQIKFSDQTFDNGMKYPVAHFSKDQTVADSMNAIIRRNLMDAEVSDFCIGDYGLIQKGNHIELHLICNCIDFAETDHRYLFFSLENGALVEYTDIFDSKEKENALKRINELVAAAGEETCKAKIAPDGKAVSWQQMRLRFYKDGLEVHPASGATENPVKVPWTEISTYLKYNFL